MAAVFRRFVVVLAVLLAMSTSVGAADASFAGVASGSLTMSSEPGDWVGQGGSYSLATPDASFSTHSDGRTALIRASTGGQDWDLSFAAPTGRLLQPGTYTGASRFAGEGEPGLSISGNSQGCNAVTGSFTVLSATYGPYGYLQTFHATFEQHCEGLGPALRGEVDVTSSPAPQAVAIHLTLDPVVHLVRGGGAAVRGTVSCNQPVNYFVPISVMVTQTKKVTTSGTNFGGVDGCDTTPKSWQITVWSDYRPNFDVGTATLRADTSMSDDFYSQYFDFNPSINASDSLTQSLRVTNG